MHYKLTKTVEEAEQELINAIVQYHEIWYKDKFNQLWDDKISGDVIHYLNGRDSAVMVVCKNALRQIAEREDDADERR